MIKVFEAFAGYGSQRMALENIGVEHEVVGISEFDKFAVASYEAIHGEVNNLGDITKIRVEDVPDHDLFTYSFPCQDISLAGKGLGFERGKSTRSGLLWECERIIKAKKPKYLLMENVKNLVSKKFMPGFQEWIDLLEEIGYKNYWEVLNSKHYGIPQNRERVFMVSILGEHEPYTFPKPVELKKKLKDVLEEKVEEKYYLNTERSKELIATITDKKALEEKTVVDATVNDPQTKDVMNAVIARYDAGITNFKSSGGAVIEPNTPEPLGTLASEDGEPKIAASRGRNKDNPKDRTKGLKLTQTLEINKEGTSNALTTVDKDNYVLEPAIIDNLYKNRDPRIYKEDAPTLRANSHGLDVVEPTAYGVSMNRNRINEEVEIAHTLMARDYKGFGNQDMTGVIEPNEHIEPTLEEEGLPIINATKKGYLIARDGDGVDLGYARTNTRRGRVQKDSIPTLTADDSKGVVELVPKEELGRMGKQAVETQKELKLPHGETLNPWNKKQSSDDGVSPTLTTRPEGFKTAINVVERYRIRKLTPLECWRLMGVKDEYFYRAQKVNSNSQLYKQAGNSIVVQVLEVIFRNMFQEIPASDRDGEQLTLF